jgi:hypothetical protein
VKGTGLVIHSAHSAHPAAEHGGRFLLRGLHDDGLGGNDETGNRGRILKRDAHNLGRVEIAGDRRWRFPVGVFELENSPVDDLVAYSLWKVLCVRAELRVVLCYRRDASEGAELVRHLAGQVVQAMEIPIRSGLGGETLIIIGSRSETATFPYGFFKDWTLDVNTQRTSIGTDRRPSMTVKPWYKVITPREDLRDGRPLDASEFAVHLDHVRDGRAPDDYKKPERFFDRTFLTSSLRELGGGVIRRLSGVKVETSAIYNLTAQFGGGKTHALTLLYHLAEAGPAASNWKGVQSLLDQAGVQTVPGAATAVFVGTEFDSLAGRGGNDGTPLRRTPWGDIAFQLGREESFAVVAKHDAESIAPSTEVIGKFLPKGKPALILMDELLNYLNRERNRKNGTGWTALFVCSEPLGGGASARPRTSRGA